MLKKYSKEFMKENCGCYSVERMESIFFTSDNEYITSNDIINSKIPIKDKFWFFCRKAGVEKIENQKLAIKIAEIVLPIFEKRYPDDKRPSEVIEAAKLFISGHISIEKLIEKRRSAAAAAFYSAAAAAAFYSAAAAAAAAAADDDAAAAYSAADAAAYSAAAYSAAAAAAAAAADDDEIKQQIESLLIEFVNYQPEHEEISITSTDR